MASKVSKTVEGKPCKKCGNTLRYIRPDRIGACVQCVHDSRGRRLASYHKRRRDGALDLDYRINRFVIETKRRAKSKGYPFNLDNEYLKSIWTDKCPISGVTFDLTLAEKGPNPNGPSVDRIIPELGYVKGNVRFVTYHINTAMSCFGEEALKALARNILRNFNE